MARWARLFGRANFRRQAWGAFYISFCNASSGSPLGKASFAGLILGDEMEDSSWRASVRDVHWLLSCLRRPCKYFQILANTRVTKMNKQLRKKKLRTCETLRVLRKEQAPHSASGAILERQREESILVQKSVQQNCMKNNVSKSSSFLTASMPSIEPIKRT